MSDTRLGLTGTPQTAYEPELNGSGTTVEQPDVSNGDGAVSGYQIITGTGATVETADTSAGVGSAGTGVNEGANTRLSLWGTPLHILPALLNRSTTEEQADTSGGVGEVVITGVSNDFEAGDNSVGEGSAFGGSTYSNLWFNTYWFNTSWFNSSWFNSAFATDGSGATDEQDDVSNGDGKSLVNGAGTTTEDRDVSDGTGSAEGDVAGQGDTIEGDDYSYGFGRALIFITGNTVESSDVSDGEGELDKITIKLSWGTEGQNLKTIDIYRSDDNITFARVSSVLGNVTEYTEKVTADSTTYYYYLIGIQTTNEETDPSDTESIVAI